MQWRSVTRFIFDLRDKTELAASDTHANCPTEIWSPSPSSVFWGNPSPSWHFRRGKGVNYPTKIWSPSWHGGIGQGGDGKPSKLAPTFLTQSLCCASQIVFFLETNYVVLVLTLSMVSTSVSLSPKEQMCFNRELGLHQYAMDFLPLVLFSI